MNYSHDYLVWVAAFHKSIEVNQKKIKHIKKDIKATRKELRKIINEPIDRFMDLSKKSKILKDKEFAVYPMRLDGLSVCVILYIEGRELVIDMAEWIGYDIDDHFAKQFNQMIEMKIRMHDLDTERSELGNWDPKRPNFINKNNTQNDE